MPKAKKISTSQEPVTTAEVAAAKKPKLGHLFGSCFCLLALILVTYAYAMTEQYVFNDPLNYTALKGVRDQGDFWLKLFATGISSPYSLQWLKATYAWDIASIGFAPGWSHAVNICLHALSCLYFYIFTFRFCWRLNNEGKTKINPYYLAAAATALLACHPLTTGSIAYVSGRVGVLGAANYFLALNCFLYGFFEEKLEYAFGGYALFFLFTAIGVASNMQCFTLPFAALALAFILKPPDIAMKDWLAERWYEMVLLLLPGLALCWMFSLAVPAQIDSSFALHALSPQIYWATQFKLIFMYYLRCVLVPFGFSVYPPYIATTGWSDPATIAGALSVLAIGVVGLIQKQPFIQFGVVLFLLNLMPWTFLVQGEIAADSRFYLSLAGLCLAAGVGIAYLAAQDFRKTLIGVGILLVAFVSLSIWRETEWYSDKRLWQAELKRDPNNARAHSYLGRYLLDNEKGEEAKAEFDKALKLNPDDFIAQAGFGFFHYQNKDYYNASINLEKAIQLGKKLNMTDEELAQYHRQLAEAYLKIGNLPSATKEAEVAMQYIKADPFLYLVIGKAQLDQQHQPLVALKTFEDGFKLDQANPDFLEPIAQSALDSGVPQVLHPAYVAAKRAVRIMHTSTANQLYVRACLELGKLSEAHSRLEVMKKSEGGNPNVMWLSYGYEKLAGNLEEAEKLRQRALAQDPTLETRVRFYLRNKPGAKLPTPEILPKGTSQPKPDIKNINPSIPNVLDPKQPNKPVEKTPDAATAPVAPATTPGTPSSTH